MKKPYSIRLIELRYKKPFETLCREWRDQGMSWRDIGERVGVDHTLIYRFARRLEERQEELATAR